MLLGLSSLGGTSGSGSSLLSTSTVSSSVGAPITTSLNVLGGSLLTSKPLTSLGGGLSILQPIPTISTSLTSVPSLGGGLSILQPTLLQPTLLQPTLLQPTPTLLQPTLLQPTLLQPTPTISRSLTSVPSLGGGLSILQPTPTLLQPTLLQPTPTISTSLASVPSLGGGLSLPLTSSPLIPQQSATLINQPQESELKLEIKKPSEFRTQNEITKYELTEIIGARSEELNSGAEPYIKIDDTYDTAAKIAKKEILDRKLPWIINRGLPDGTIEKRELRKLIIPNNLMYLLKK
jgi:DNA-directed RNA polymerase subunit K/omega